MQITHKNKFNIKTMRISSSKHQNFNPEYMIPFSKKVVGLLKFISSGHLIKFIMDTCQLSGCVYNTNLAAHASRQQVDLKS
jgi:hypothetical protein